MQKFDIQYNKTAEQFNDLYLDQKAHISTNDFFTIFTDDLIKKLPNKKVLDFGCGAGADAKFYAEKGLQYSGVDASSGMVEIAQKNKEIIDVRNESFSEKLSFDNNSFGTIVSKYAIQIPEKIENVYEQANRILVSGGYFIFLVVHPLRQFLEKKKSNKDYFKKEIVESIIFDGKIKVFEQTHTLEEYFSDYFLEKFSLIKFKEGYDFPASEQIGGDTYPTYMIVIAKKK